VRRARVRPRRRCALRRRRMGRPAAPPPAASARCTAAGRPWRFGWSRRAGSLCSGAFFSSTIKPRGDAAGQQRPSTEVQRKRAARNTRCAGTRASRRVIGADGAWATPRSPSPSRAATP
jgi:hypothetical protein